MSGVGDSIIVISAVVTIGLAALSVIGWLGRKAWKVIRRFTLFLDDYEGTEARPGVDARPGVMQRLQGQGRVLNETVETAKRLQTAIGEQAVTLTAQGEVLAELKRGLEAVIDELPKNGVPLASKIDALWTRHIAEQAAAAAVAQTTVVVQPAQLPPAGPRPLEDGS